MAEQLPHLIFNRTAITKAYQVPRRAIVSEFKLAPRDRQQHGAQLLDELQQVQAQELGLVADQKALGRDAGMGVYLTFESDPGFELAFESLGFVPSGIELLALKEEEGRMLATVFVPEGKISHFIRKVEAYLDPARDISNKKNQLQPKNRKLVDSIGQIRLAALEALWTDSPELFPRHEQPIWWEVWLRCGQSFDEVGFFRTHARAMGMEVPDEEVRFLERCILLVRSDINQMARSLHHLGGMAGLALHGDLSESLAEQPFPSPAHRLESVKVLPPHGDNPPHLYGSLYSEAVARVEITAPHRRRAFCSAVTTTDSRARGRPSSWSAQLDKLASGMEGNDPRLIFQAAGNTDHAGIPRYPTSNETDEIHDPGQAWNALTVGAYTEKWRFNAATHPGRALIAPPGALAPTSCTAIGWPTRGRQKWPNKPDIVMEGGNWALDTAHHFAEDLDSLQLLTTGHEPLTKPLVTFGETSASTALAARMAAVLLAHYPDLWPETLRALMAHSAQWTPAMKANVADMSRKADVRRILRSCGFGVPNLQDALWSARHALTLIVQDEMQPFTTGADGTIRTRDIHYHALPWPVEALQALPLGTPVEMRVTLSYFIQPNPGQRGWTGRFNYASHGLRFRVKAPGESHAQFEQRINQASRDEEYERTGVSDNDFWLVGSDTRELGSLHSDIWRGTASGLADCGYLAVYPVSGWWRTRKALDRWHSRARYALVVSIRTPEEMVDIYTSVATAVGIVV